MASRLVKPNHPTYSYVIQPKEAQRQKYRQSTVSSSNESPNVVNLMYDRRVVRGNTYAKYLPPIKPRPNLYDLQRQQEGRRRALARRRALELFQTKTPEPVDNRKHMVVQTELYLEELSDRIEEADVYVQTERLLDRPSSPLYIPQVTGRDTATQIEEGDLFDFDIEVKPIAEVLVGKTSEQALVEIAEEEEIIRIREQHRKYEELRNSELIELQRFEEQERRLRTEKERRTKQAEEAHRQEQELAEKMAARAFTRAYLQDLVPSVFHNLRENGFFYDPVEHETESTFMPWLMDRTMTHVNKLVIGRSLLDSTIRDVVNQRIDQYQRIDESHRQVKHSSKRRSTTRENSVHGSEKSQQQRKSTSGELRETPEDNRDETNTDTS
ncbi:unnamed protein product [Adineta steineri]|uniref:Uncharacterized protein n=1 Tax=Adineta steineri TaxID=433720 RepID=A0A814LYK8_9BILA|nr:unnamed protein product [Adineta steineri]CAF3782078.1 unnamed protein product [Adineta steineri]